MDTLEELEYLKVKNVLYDMMVSEQDFLDEVEMARVLTHELQAIFRTRTTSLYLFSEWNRQFSLMATTSLEQGEVMKAFPDIWSEEHYFEEDASRIHTYEDGTFYCLPLMHHGEIVGVLQLECFAHNRISLRLETARVCSRDLAQFVKKYRKMAKMFDEEKRHEFLYRVTSKFHASMKMQDVLAEIIVTMQNVFPTFSSYLLLSHDHTAYENLPVKELQYDSDYDHMVAMQAFVTGQVQFDEVHELGQAVLYAPLKGKQGVYGVMEVSAPHLGVFIQEEVDFITLLANTAGNAIENAQLYEQSKRLIADLQLINDTSHRLNSNLRLVETISFMSTQIQKSFDAEEAGFILCEEGSYNVLKGSTDFFFTDEAVRYIEHALSKIKTVKDSVFIGDITIDPQFASRTYYSIMAVPMVQGTIVKGIALVLHRETYHFSFDMFKLFQSLIHHSTLAFTNSMLREELEKLVITDYLTKLYSRNYLDAHIQKSIETDPCGAFLIIDIDNFKRVNDTYGHQVGDEVIIQIANAMRQTIREQDIAARWGGEELAIYMPNATMNEAKKIAERLVACAPQVSKPNVTISCGVASWTTEQIDEKKHLFLRADSALYEAKHTGKNRVVLAK